MEKRELRSGAFPFREGEAAEISWRHSSATFSFTFAGQTETPIPESTQFEK